MMCQNCPDVHDTHGAVYGIFIARARSKIFFEKGIDKSLFLCYTQSTKGEGKATTKSEVPTRASKSLLPMIRPQGVPVCGI